MPLKLMYITNQTQIAKIAQKAGVDRIWVDLEVLGKQERQTNIDSVKSKHTIDDVAKIKPLLNSSELLVRVNPINIESRYEINKVIENGADIVMLPMFRTKEEANRFLGIVDGRAKTCLLVETKEAEEQIDEILTLSGIDEIHIGLNDLHLAHHLKFMFELLSNGTVERLCGKFKEAGIDYGFGGIARIGQGILPSEHIIAEHYRLGSTRAILSRSFCNTDILTDLNKIEELFCDGIKLIRSFENDLSKKQIKFFINNQKIIKNKVEYILAGIGQGNQNEHCNRNIG